MSSGPDVSTLLERLLPRLREPIETELRAAADAWTAAAAAEHRAMEARADEVRQQAQAQVESAQAQVEAARARAEALQAQLDAAQAQAEAGQARLEAVRAELDAAHAQVEDVRHDLEDRIARAEGDAEALRSQLDGARRTAEAAAAAAARDLRDARDAAQVQIETLRREYDDRASAADRETARLRQELETLHQTAADGTRTALAADAAVVAAFRAIEEPGTLGDVLDAITRHAARLADRAAVLVVREGHLRGWRLQGFGASDDAPRGIDLPLTDAGAVGRAVTTKEPIACGEGDGAASCPAFAATSSRVTAIALPLIVGGQVVAVVYADAPWTTAPSWPARLELLARHASARLEAMTLQYAAGLRPAAPSARGGAQARLAADVRGRV